MIPLFDLTRQIQTIGSELDEGIAKVVKRGVFILGQEVLLFEEEFAHYLGVVHAIGVASGTDALSLALLAVGIQPGDEVIVAANCYPTVFAITAIGAMPRLVDIDPVTFTIDPDKIPDAITRKTKAIIPVHLYGHPANMKRVMEIGKRKGIVVVEDCAQAAGATLSVAIPALSAGAEMAGSHSHKLPKLPRLLRERTIWKKVGSIGDIGCFSFYPTKNLGAFGDGGIVVTDNPEIAGRVRRLRMYGETSRYHSIEPGRNSRLDELQAAILRVKKKYIDRWNERRRIIASKYESGIRNQEFSNLQPTTYNLQLPVEVSYARHVYHLYVICSKKRDQLKAYLEEKGIGTGIHYPVPIHLVSSMKYLGYKKGDFLESEKASQEVISLPMFPELTDEEIKTVTEVIAQFCAMGK